MLFIPSISIQPSMLEMLLPIITVLVIICNKSTCCPDSCICKWKNGKVHVDCKYKNFLIIPEGMESSTQVLEFNGNNLRTLHSEKFMKMNLINLQRIYMPRCHIRVVEQHAFKGLTNLVELDLSGNLLENIPTSSFPDCPSLMRLTLSSNPIKSLSRAAFSHLSFLNTLELSNCEISTDEDWAFQGLYSLEWLRLNDNKMTSFAASHLPVSLKGVELHENPWECDCHILQLHGWLQSFNYPHSIDPVCRGPSRLSGHIIKSLPVKEMACYPNITPSSFFMSIEKDKNISLSCQVQATPAANISWWYRGYLLSNDSEYASEYESFQYVERRYGETESDLLIYNINIEDNGTFICTAENSAGIANAVFSIKVTVKYEEFIKSGEIPSEFTICLFSAGITLVILFILLIVLSVVKCCKKKHHQTNEKNKTNNMSTNSLLETNSENSKIYSEGTNTTLSELDSKELDSALPVEQNPDIVSETVKLPPLSLDKHTIHYTAQPVRHFCETSSLQTAYPSYVHKLATLERRISDQCEANYRTLPCNRSARRLSTANPVNRAIRETEFLMRNSELSSRGYFDTEDVRYTADGYPVRTKEHINSSDTFPWLPLLNL